jgi:general secretion pathway protein D
MKRFFWLFLLANSLFAESPVPSEPILSADVAGAQEFNQSLADLKGKLREKFKEGALITHNNANELEYRGLLSDIKEIKEKIRSLEEGWRKTSIDDVAHADEAYALWDVGETTLAQLIMEYGASDFLYIIPQELSGMKMSLFSSIPLPRESWSEMIEMILSQNGVGVKKLNPFAKQLYILKLDPSIIEGIVAREEDLELFPNHARLFYVFSPPPEQLRSVQSFFERFSDAKQTTIQSIGSKVAIVSNKETVDKLLGLYHAVWEQNKGKVVRILTPTKINSQEAEKILKAVFSDSGNKARPTFYPSGADELMTISLPQGLVLIGEEETVTRAEKILADLENQLEDPGEKLIYWYACKHANPEDIAEVLSKVYDSLIGSNFEKKTEGQTAISPPPPAPPVPSQDQPNPGQVFPFPDRSTAFNPVLPANPPFVQPGVIDKGPKATFGNFIVDSKTTSLLMVVRREELSKIKTLLKKLDTPKRMVQLDVLLVEKKLHDRRQIGFNLLQFGTNASGKNENAITFDTSEKAFHKGVLSYIFSRQSNGWPAMDLTYNFLMAQEDIRINANPSVLAVNQTPATISIVEEISINNGAIQLDTTSGITVEQSYTRAQYGITIVLTPTIHMPDSEVADSLGFVSLQTDLEFDTTQHTINDRPPVTRRHIQNEVRVADGETIILGGLRRKIEEDTREKIPFLGDLPGIGKLFGAVKSTESNTEMFIFITPRIIPDPVDDLRCIRQSEYQKRAGDIPEFLERIDEAQNKERKRLFSHSLKTLFDMY